MTDPVDFDALISDSPATELASARTSLALERTRMSADRTLMATLRTSLALIGFGFTIVKFFHEVGKERQIEDVMAMPARNFGLSLVIMGVGLLIMGLLSHKSLFADLRARRLYLLEKRLLHHGPSYRSSSTAIVAVLLLLAGLLVILGILARIGPFGLN